MKISDVFYLKIFIFLVVKYSVYLNRHFFIMFVYYRVECAPTRLLARKSDTKYLQHRWLPSYYDFVLMITKCKQKSSKGNLKELCENDNIRDTLESITPVSVSSTTYKNKFCAYCNNVGIDEYLQNWQVGLSCDADLSRSTSSLVATVIRRKCNFHYIPPENAHMQACKRWSFPGKQSCDVTVAKPDGESMCSAHTKTHPVNLHPVNTTYICTSCYNNKTVEKRVSVCGLSDPTNMKEAISPPFLAILDLDALTSSPQIKSSENCDPATQFKDDKLVSFIVHNKSYLYEIISRLVSQDLALPNSSRFTFNPKLKDQFVPLCHYPP